MSRRRDMLAAVSFAQGRQAHEGANTSLGCYERSPFDLTIAQTWECYFTTKELLTGDVGTNQIIISSTPSPAFRLYLQGNTLQIAGIGGKQTQIIVTANTDYHIVLSADDSGTNVYINGALQTKLAYGSNTVIPTQFNIGSWWSTGLRFLGDMHHVRIFNYALSAAEVATLYNEGKPEEYVLPRYYKDAGIFQIPNAMPWAAPNGTDYIKRVVTYHSDFSASKFQDVYSYIIGYMCKRASYRVSIQLHDHTQGELRMIWHRYPSTAGDAVYFKIDENGLATVIMPDVNRTGSFFIRATATTDGWWNVDTDLTIEKVGCIAEYLPQNITPTQWLDSAQQLPINDEYLPPLRGSIGGYDLAASGAPEVVYKPRLTNFMSYMSPMQLTDIKIIGGIMPTIDNGAIKVQFDGLINSYYNGVYYTLPFEIPPHKSVLIKYEAKCSDAENNRIMPFLGTTYGQINYPFRALLSTEWSKYELRLDVSQNTDKILRALGFYPSHYYAQQGYFYIKNVEILVYDK